MFQTLFLWGGAIFGGTQESPELIHELDVMVQCDGQWGQPGGDLGTLVISEI